MLWGIVCHSPYYTPGYSSDGCILWPVTPDHAAKVGDHPIGDWTTVVYNTGSAVER